MNEEAKEAPQRFLRKVAVDKITMDFGNHRWETSPTVTLEPLKESMAENGLLSPPLLRVHSQKDGCYQVVFGHRRVMAAKLLASESPDQWSEIEVELAAEGLSDAGARSIQMQENLARADLSPIEEAMGIREMVWRDSKTQKRVASELSMDAAGVKRRLNLLDLSEEPCKLIHRGELSAAHGQVLHRHLKGEEELQDHFARRAAEEELTVELLETYIKERLEGEAEEEDPDEERIPPMGPTPTPVFGFREDVLPEEGRESEADAFQVELLDRLELVAELMAFNDQELRREMELPLPYYPADVEVIRDHVWAMEIEEVVAVKRRLTRRFFEAGHRKGLLSQTLISEYMSEELSSPAPGLAKGGFS